MTWSGADALDQQGLRIVTCDDSIPRAYHMQHTACSDRVCLLRAIEMLLCIKLQWVGLSCAPASASRTSNFPRRIPDALLSGMFAGAQNSGRRIGGGLLRAALSRR